MRSGRLLLRVFLVVSLTSRLEAQAPPDVTLETPRAAVRSDPGVTLEYALARAASNVTIEIVDARGIVVRSLKGTSDAGRHRALWDLRHAGPIGVEGTDAPADVGPLAIPGEYSVRLVVDAKSLSKPLVVQRDPRQAGMSDADLRARLDLALQIRDMLSRSAQALADIRSLKRQVADRVPQARSPAVGLAADVVTRRLNEAQQAFPYDRLAGFRRGVQAADGRPAAADHQAFGERSAEVEAAFEILRGVIANEITAFNTMLTNGGLKALDLPQTLPKPR